MLMNSKALIRSFFCYAKSINWNFGSLHCTCCVTVLFFNFMFRTKFCWVVCFAKIIVQTVNFSCHLTSISVWNYYRGKRNQSKWLKMTSMRPPSKSTLLKVVILGDGGVGKSCLMNRFVSNQFDENSFHTIGVEFLNKDIEIDGQKYTLQASECDRINTLWTTTYYLCFRFLLQIWDTGNYKLFTFDVVRMLTT